MVTSRFAVESNETGQRLDHVLRRRFPKVSRRVLKLWFDEARIRVSGKCARKGDRVEYGQYIEVAADTDDPAESNGAEPGLDILFESENVVVINKAAGLPCAPLRASETRTVANGLLRLYPSMSDFGYSARDAGLIHRLDNDTSGSLVAAKTSRAFEVLVEALKRGDLRKSYLAWTRGRPPEREGTIDLPLRPDPNNRRKVCVATLLERGAKRSVTHFRVLGYSESMCLIRAEASVATRHQVRAHLAAVGCPLLGDSLYGGATDARIQRHALHAERVTFRGQDEINAFDCTSPLPADLVALGLTPGCWSETQADDDRSNLSRGPCP